MTSLKQHLNNYVTLTGQIRDLKHQLKILEQSLVECGKVIQQAGVPEEFTVDGPTIDCSSLYSYRFRIDVDDQGGVIEFEQYDALEAILDESGNLARNLAR